MKTFTLYRPRDLKTQYWSIHWDRVSYRTVYGWCNIETSTDDAPDSESVVQTDWTMVEGKHIGKANEVSIKEQVIIMVNRIIQDKLDAGYVAYKDLKDNPDAYFRCMLCAKYSVERLLQKLVKYELTYVYIQAKLDGVRCLIHIDHTGAIKAFSKENNQFVNIARIFQGMFRKYNIVLDGELFHPELTFSEIISMVKTIDESDQLNDDKIKNLRYNIFDCYVPSEPYAPFEERMDFLKKYLKGRCNDHIQIIPTTRIDLNMKNIERDIKRALRTYGSEEGLIIRLNTPYEQGKRLTTFKLKLIDSAEFQVLDIFPGKGNKSGMAGSALVRVTKSIESKVSIAADRNLCREYLQNKCKYIGQLATVQFQGYTSHGKLRFGELIAMRDYE